MAATLPEPVKKYAESPIFTEQTVPKKLTREHDTKPGVWGRLIVLKGELDFVIPGLPAITDRIDIHAPAIIEPTVLHYLVLDGPVTFKIEFLK
ncbi:hypothetical protein GCM10009069_16900 [Algimonas arctica]|uniref:TehB/YeaR-like domain-containing protein n=1 Tax=Algimonas arctica TaxID=1479486 RepID=A0A8J3CSE2_9PROT|nr:DUF1971 domain-containing protein [Algimonas arctica]GHA94579.1 hypothetical protein GCM10009069_16900 [Algimonas arctica]